MLSRPPEPDAGHEERGECEVDDESVADLLRSMKEACKTAGGRAPKKRTPLKRKRLAKEVALMQKRRRIGAAAPAECAAGGAAEASVVEGALADGAQLASGVGGLAASSSGGPSPALPGVAPSAAPPAGDRGAAPPDGEPSAAFAAVLNHDAGPAPAPPRQARAEQWGVFQVAPLFARGVHVGYGGVCRRHVNSSDHAGAVCKKTMRFCGESPEETRLRIKMWLVEGIAIVDGGAARSDHLGVDTRSQPLMAEDALDCMLADAALLA